MPYVDVNYLAVLAAAILSMAIGAFWYSPAGLGTQWQQLIGLRQAELDKAKARGMNKLYAINFIGALVMMYVLARIVGLAGAATLISGAVVGFWVWLGFIATIMLGSITWENKPVKLYYLNAGYQLVNLVVGGALLAMWA